MKITVTQDDIDQGRRCNCAACPVALAVRRAKFIDPTKPGTQPTVGRDSVEFGGNHVWLPIEAVEFIARFDDGRSVQPFSFNLEAR